MLAYEGAGGGEGIDVYKRQMELPVSGQDPAVGAYEHAGVAGPLFSRDLPVSYTHLKQEQNFMAASKLAQQAKKRFVPIVGYGYGKKKTSSRGLPKFYMELAGKDFWTELTGDEEFYIKLIRFMDKLPEKYVEEFDASYQKASNRLVREFTQEFCFADGSIDWEKLVEFNSGE